MGIGGLVGVDELGWRLVVEGLVGADVVVDVFPLAKACGETGEVGGAVEQSWNSANRPSDRWQGRCRAALGRLSRVKLYRHSVVMGREGRNGAVAVPR